jgi:hypothetical protein
MWFFLPSAITSIFEENLFISVGNISVVIVRNSNGTAVMAGIVLPLLQASVNIRIVFMSSYY